jgi:hypothetical protein
MSRLTVLALALAAIAACEKKNENTGLPPATQWQGSAGGGAGGPIAPGDPHAGMGGGAGAGDPHAGMDMGGGGDPHAGMDMGGGGGDPHAGMGMGGGAGMGPDPNRPINPNVYLRGTITVAPAVKAKVSAGGAVFLSVKRPDPATGEGVGMPLAVAKVSLVPDGFAFDLTERDAMMGGTSLDGEVVITARYDQDSDAFTKQPGDVSGKVKATVPAKDLKIVLETVQP